MSTGNTFAGVRVELSPGLDLWMQGARFGTLRSIEPVSQVATVKVDSVRKLQRIKLQDLSARTARFIGPKGVMVSRETHLLKGAIVYFLDHSDGRVCVTPEVPPSVLSFWLNPDDLERI
jgi:hypothetical protein